MRASGQILATILKLLEEQLSVGMTTQQLADSAGRELKALGGKPAFLGYFGYPDVLCVSINDEVVHGIPSSRRVIEDGDIVSIDFGVLYEGMITDSALTTIAGRPKSATDTKLVQDTRKSLNAGIGALHGGVMVGDVAAAIQKVLDDGKYGVVRDLVGHGVGHELHEDPNIPNYGSRGMGPKLEVGMTIAIEPMATLGDYRVYIENDGWTVRTRDGSRAAHFEHTVLITENGAEILTERRN